MITLLFVISSPSQKACSLSFLSGCILFLLALKFCVCLVLWTFQVVREALKFREVSPPEGQKRNSTDQLSSPQLRKVGSQEEAVYFLQGREPRGKRLIHTEHLLCAWSCAEHFA